MRTQRSITARLADNGVHRASNDYQVLKPSSHPVTPMAFGDDAANASRRAAQIVREGPISQRLGEMDAAHLILAIEVRERAGDPQNAVIAAR